jgi:hypothetical protein
VWFPALTLVRFPLNELQFVHRRAVDPLSSVLFIHMAVTFTMTDKGTVLVL